MTTRAAHRGVWKAPWRGPKGEVVLFALDSKHRLVGELKVIAAGADAVEAADDMWAVLDAVDPRYAGQACPAPLFKSVPKKSPGGPWKPRVLR